MNRSSVVCIVAFGLCFAIAVVVLFNSGERQPAPMTDEELALIPSTVSYATPSITPGINQPPHHRVDEVRLSDDEEVIGVVVKNQSRAYWVPAFVDMNQHVVNDVLEGVAITVTYCDQADYVRVVTDDTRTDPIGLACGGWSGSQMLLLLDQQYFDHDSADLPLSDFRFERTTWKEWKTKHPDTRVYLGPNAGPVESEDIESDTADGTPSAESR